MFTNQVQHGSKRKEEYREMSKGCAMYEPCEINYKCKNKATHLYERCQRCPIPHATHDHKARAWAIKRENQASKISQETYESIKEQADSVLRPMLETLERKNES